MCPKHTTIITIILTNNLTIYSIILYFLIIIKFNSVMSYEFGDEIRYGIY